MEKQLAVIKDLQTELDGSHVGGSIGLFLHGFSLNRSLENSDIDLAVKAPLNNAEKLQYDIKESSRMDDFDYVLKRNGFKIDVSIRPNFIYKIIEFDGFNYRVTNLEYILYFKRLYADKGEEKHKKDLEQITELLTVAAL